MPAEPSPELGGIEAKTKRGSINVRVAIRQKQTGSSRNVEDTLPLKRFKGGDKATTF